MLCEHRSTLSGTKAPIYTVTISSRVAVLEKRHHIKTFFRLFLTFGPFLPSHSTYITIIYYTPPIWPPDSLLVSEDLPSSFTCLLSIFFLDLCLAPFWMPDLDLDLDLLLAYFMSAILFRGHLFVALELLCSISSFAGFEKRGVKVVSLHYAQSYFCILTAGFKAYGIPNSS